MTGNFPAHAYRTGFRGGWQLKWRQDFSEGKAGRLGMLGSAGATNVLDLEQAHLLQYRQTAE